MTDNYDKATRDELLAELRRVQKELDRANAKLNVHAEKHRRDEQTIAEYLANRKDSHADT